jgi:formamidopyrimidine-DNA glycosylase
MPELPDLEVFKGNIFNRLSSKKLTGAEVFNTSKMTVPKQYLLDELAGRELLSVGRLGKELLFDFGEGKVVAAHLMLNGTVSIIPEEAAGAVKFKIFSLQFERETIVFSDRGGLCTVKYKPPPGKAPDAFADAFTLGYFLGTAQKKGMTIIKSFLIDQSVVKGIGNAYADEILYAARVAPQSLTGRIPEEKLTELYHAIRAVMTDAIAEIKRISPDIISGEERSFLKVHNKNLKQTATGYPITIERVVSKITYYTEEQVMY